MNRNSRTTNAPRSRQDSPCPRCWEEVDQRLARLGEIEEQTEALAARLHREVAELKRQALEASRELEEEQGRLRREIERFYWARRDEVLASGLKSVELPSGRLGTRRSRSVVVEDAAAALAWLVSGGFQRHLRTRTEIDREAIRAVLLNGNGLGNNATDLLRCPVIGLREREEFWYEVDFARGSALASPRR